MKISKTLKPDASILRWLNLMIGILMTGFFLYFYISHEHAANVFAYHFSQSYKNGFVFMLAAIFFVPLNLYFEYLKWACQDVGQGVGRQNKFSGVLIGATFSSISPGRTGDYLGRLFVVPNQEKPNTIYYGMISGSVQFLMNVSFGILGMLVLLFGGHLVLSGSLYLMLFSVLTVVFVLAALFFHKTMLTFLSNFSVFKQFKKLALIPPKVLAGVSFYAFMRYLVYVVQFALILAFFQSDLPLLLVFAGMATVFLMQSFIPVIGLLELGVKGSLALFVFSFYQETSLIIIPAFGLLWLLNVVLPGLAGCAAWLMMKTRK